MNKDERKEVFRLVRKAAKEASKSIVVLGGVGVFTYLSTKYARDQATKSKEHFVQAKNLIKNTFRK